MIVTRLLLAACEVCLYVAVAGLILVAAGFLALIAIRLYDMLGPPHWRNHLPRAFVREADLPSVLVQIPVFNEHEVAIGAMRAAAALDWPRDRLRIQILDDSTDESVEMIARAALALESQGGARDHLHALVRRIVEDLDAQAVAGPVQRGGRPHRADGDLVLVEHGNLYQHRGQVCLAHEGTRQVVAPVRRPQHVVEADRDQGEEAGGDQDQAGDGYVEANLAGGEQQPSDDQNEAYIEEGRVFTRSPTAMALPRRVQASLALARSMASDISCFALAASPQPVIFTHLVFSRSL